MVPRVLPYLPSPRPAAPELGRRATSPPWNRIVGLIEHLAGVLLFVAVPMLFAATATYFLLADWSIWWRASGFIVFMTIAIVYSKSLLPRRKLIPPAVIPVVPGDQPTPYAFLRESPRRSDRPCRGVSGLAPERNRPSAVVVRCSISFGSADGKCKSACGSGTG